MALLDDLHNLPGIHDVRSWLGIPPYDAAHTRDMVLRTDNTGLALLVDWFAPADYMGPIAPPGTTPTSLPPMPEGWDAEREARKAALRLSGWYGGGSTTLTRPPSSPLPLILALGILLAIAAIAWEASK